MERDIFAHFDNGTLAASGTAASIASLPWNEHKDFKGVFLKNIVTADLTGGLFTCHLVRIEPGMKIGLHTHPTSIELHEVISGSGKCLTKQGEIVYGPGSMSVLPENSPHEVLAGERGLCLFAKFITVPA